MLPGPEILSYEDLSVRANAFLDEYWPERSIPVDIESIVDVGEGGLEQPMHVHVERDRQSCKIWL